MSAPSSPAPAPASPPSRVMSIDAYRGFVMFLMMAEVLRFHAVSRNFPGSGFWRFLAHHQSHIEWIGCTLHDLIQPSFSFLVGTALAFSVASRQARGQAFGPMLGHAIWRAFALSALGILLRSVGRSQTNFTFEDTLTQIGLGYVPLFLLGFRPRRDHWLATGVLLVGIWLAFVLYPAPAPGQDLSQVGVSAEWLREHGQTGLAAHWQKNANLAWRADVWFLNLFPREKPFLFNGGGYSTLSFIPTLATMVLGLIAGGILRADSPARPAWRRLAILGGSLLAAGWLAGLLGLCPVVKRIWTPSWVLFSGGWCFLLLGGFHLLLDRPRWKGWSFPLLVVGANSIAAYCIAHLWEDFVSSTFRTHLGPDAFKILGAGLEPLVHGAAVLAVFWLILYWMYRRRIFLRL